MNSNLIMGLDVSTATIGISIIEENTNSDIHKLHLLTHVSPKIDKNIKGFESLLLKKNIFENQFLKQWVNMGISTVVIEEPLLKSNNVNTVGVLYRFNALVSESVYRLLGVVPTYISSYDSRKYAFPELMAVRKFDKKGNMYSDKKIEKEIKDNKLVLFGDYPWDIDKKQVVWDKICEKYPDINWLYKQNGDLKKENFDMADSLTVCQAFVNMKRLGKISVE